MSPLLVEMMNSIIVAFFSIQHSLRIDFNAFHTGYYDSIA